MSHVFKIFNAAGQLQVSDSFMVPQFIGRIVTQADGISANQGAEMGLESRSYSGAAPNFGGRNVIVYWAFPEGHWWWAPSPFMSSGSSGLAHVGMYALVTPGTAIVGAPVGYVFALDFVQHSGVQPALRTWRDGNLMFDSGTLHLATQLVISGVTYPIGSDHNIGVSLPTKPGFLLPHVVRTVEQYDGDLEREDGVAHLDQWISMVRRSGNTVTTRFLQVVDQDVGASDSGSRLGYTEDATYGNTSGLIIPVINATLYD